MGFQISDLVYCLMVSFLFQTLAFGAQKNYIVYLGFHSHGGISELSNTDAIVQAVTESHYNLLGSVLGRSWDYMSLENHGAEASPGPLWKAANYGEGTIIATLDSGVWPESKSFDDEGYGPVPSKWKGFCQNNTKAGVPCNRKLIGARYFNKAYIRAGGKPENSPRDYEGHGTHTLSTAGGNFVPRAKIFNSTAGTAKGGSPKARVASYKVCWTPIDFNQCFDSDIMSAFDAAINDGVDVISVSLGGEPSNYFEDAIAIGSFHAVQKGIVVTCSAGNSGPFPGTVSNVAPWITTVAASTLDRKFAAFVQLRGGLRIEGKTLYGSMSKNKTYPLRLGSEVRAANVSINDALFCKNNTLDPKKAKGKILACLTPGYGGVYTSQAVASAGAAGMILCNDKLNGDILVADRYYLPTVHISYKDSLAVFNYINSTKHPHAYISPLTQEINVKPAPVMAIFSAAGPNTITPQILKPDITAPGVDILASWTEAKQTGIGSDPRTTPYNVDSGTSMSCPHVAGVFGLLRTVYPNWSPAAIRSAIMTTARTRDNTGKPIRNYLMERATPFSYGSGHIRPNQAMNPGLVYDITGTDYLNFLCASGYNKTQLMNFTDTPYKCPESAPSILDLNYPSITVPALPSTGSITVTRKLKNVGKPSKYAVSVKEPKGVLVSVKPKVLKFKKEGEEKKFKVTLKAKWDAKGNEYVFGGITWTDGVHYVRSPVAVHPA
ncbi:Subtilisin-like protease SBT5.4 [Linum grandiflorum]